MNSNDKKKLKVNFVEIVRTVRVEDVQDYLYANSILTEDDMDELDMKNVGMTQRKATRMLLRRLPKRGPKAYSAFISALREDPPACQWLADMVERTDVSKVEEVDEVDNFTEQEKLDQLRNQILDQTAVLSKLYRENENYKKQLEAAFQRNDKSAIQDTMQIYGLNEKIVIDFIRQYPSKTNLKTAQLKEIVAAAGSPIAKKKGHTGEEESFDESDYHEISEEEKIARSIGRYIVEYMFSDDPKYHRQCVAPDKYSEKMRLLVDEVLKLHGDAFHKYLLKLNIDEINGLDTLANIGNEMFKEGEQNWGRIITFYAFGSYLARHCGTMNEKFSSEFGNFLGFFIATNQGKWIHEEGGWESFIKKFPTSEPMETSSWKNALLTLFGVGALVSYIATKTGTNT